MNFLFGQQHINMLVMFGKGTTVSDHFHELMGLAKDRQLDLLHTTPGAQFTQRVTELKNTLVRLDKIADF